MLDLVAKINQQCYTPHIDLKEYCMHNVASLAGYKHLSTGSQSQDYGLSFSVEGIDVCIVSDGCSTGGNTDLGSRYLVMSVKKLIAEDSTLLVNPHDLEKEIVGAIHRNEWNLDDQDMFATIQILSFDGSHYRLTSFGDGCFGFKTKDGLIHLKEISYSDNAPYYVLYNKNKEYGNAWNLSASKKRIITKTIIKEGTKLIENEDSVEFVLEEPSSSHFLNTYHTEIISKEDLEYFFVATDGLTSIAEDLIKNVYETVSIKGFAGDFIKRRLGAQTRHWLKNVSQYPADDLTIALIKGD